MQMGGSVRPLQSLGKREWVAACTHHQDRAESLALLTSFSRALFIGLLCPLHGDVTLGISTPTVVIGGLLWAVLSRLYVCFIQQPCETGARIPI